MIERYSLNNANSCKDGIKSLSSFQCIYPSHSNFRYTDPFIAFCSKYCSKYSAKFHSHNYRMRQKCKAETKTLQLTKTSKLSDETLQPIEIFKLSDETYKLTIETLHVVDTLAELYQRAFTVDVS